MVVRRSVGFILICTFLMVGVGANVSFMIDIPSVILVFGGIVSMLLIGRHNIGTMISTVFVGDADESRVREAIQGYRMGRYYSMVAAVISLGVGLTIMMKNLNDPSAIGPGMAIILCSTLYAVFIGFVLFVGLQAGLQKRIGETLDARLIPESILVIVYCTVATVVVFGILMLNFLTES